MAKRKSKVKVKVEKVETTAEMLRRLINFIEADPDCYEGDDGTLSRLVEGGKRAMVEEAKARVAAEVPRPKWLRTVNPDDLNPVKTGRPSVVIEFEPRRMRDAGIGFVDEGTASFEDIKKYPVVLRPWVRLEGVG